MMRINGFECDLCKKMHTIPETYGNFAPPRHHLPADWLTAFRGTGENVDPLNFCSDACLRQWALAQEGGENWSKEERRVAQQVLRGALGSSQESVDDGLSEEQRQILEEILAEVRQQYRHAIASCGSRAGGVRLVWTISLRGLVTKEKP